jgi:hypothetical protein
MALKMFKNYSILAKLIYPKNQEGVEESVPTLVQSQKNGQIG